MTMDEIQTGFWYPEVFLFKQYDITPDLVVVGKGMTAGFHPLAGLIYRSSLDFFEQYDALNTNGNATLAALVSLGGLELLKQHSDEVQACADRHFQGQSKLATDFPDIVECANGQGFLSGLRFKRVEHAIALHKAAVARGLWLRVHAYHEGHRTILMKLPLVFNAALVDALHGILRELLSAHIDNSGQ